MSEEKKKSPLQLELEAIEASHKAEFEALVRRVVAELKKDLKEEKKTK